MHFSHYIAARPAIRRARRGRRPHSGMTYIKIFKTINFAVPSEIESEEVEIFRELLFIATCGNVFWGSFSFDKSRPDVARTHVKKKRLGNVFVSICQKFFFARPGCRRVKHMFR